MRHLSIFGLAFLLNLSIAFSQAQSKTSTIVQSQALKNDHCDQEKKISDLPPTIFSKSLFGRAFIDDKRVPTMSGTAVRFNMFWCPVKFKPIQHAPNDGKERCHNFKKGGKEPNCKCWGKYHPDYDKCKPPQESEDIKCTNYCHSTMCDCRIKCNP